VVVEWWGCGGVRVKRGRRPPENRKEETGHPRRRTLRWHPKRKDDRISAGRTEEESGQEGIRALGGEEEELWRLQRQGHGEDEQATAAGRQARPGFPEKGRRDRAGGGVS
jgi:hypothetical protein